MVREKSAQVHDDAWNTEDEEEDFTLTLNRRTAAEHEIELAAINMSTNREEPVKPEESSNHDEIKGLK